MNNYQRKINKKAKYILGDISPFGHENNVSFYYCRKQLKKDIKIYKNNGGIKNEKGVQ